MKNFTYSKTKLVKRISAIVGCFILVGGISGGAYAYTTPTSYVSMDVNPSIEYTLNMFNRVLSVRAVNEDGAKILQEVNLVDFSNKSISNAVKLTLNEITAKGYFDGNIPGGIVIATTGKTTDKAENLADYLEKVVTAQCAEDKHTVSIETVTVNQTQLDEAKALGVTPGKLLLIQELQSEVPVGMTFVTAEWLNKSVKEIMAETKRLDALNDADDMNDAGDTDGADDIDDADDADDADDINDADDTDDAEKAEKTKEAVTENLEKQKDLNDKAEDVAEEAKEKAEDASEEAEDKAEDTQDEAKEALDEAKEALDEVEEAQDDDE